MVFYKRNCSIFRGIKSNYNFQLATPIQNLWRDHNGENFIGSVLKIDKAFSSENPLSIDVIFSANHDMVRIGSLLVGDIFKIKSVACLLLTLPRQPISYYGEEIEMLGKDQNLYVHEPYLWTENIDAFGNTNLLIVEFSVLGDVESLAMQILKPNSIINVYKRLIKFRNTEMAL